VHFRSFASPSFTWGSLLLLSWSGVACSNNTENDRPAYDGGGCDSSCGTDGAVGFSDGDDAGSGGAGGGGSVSATGSVVAFADTGFVTTSPVTEGLTVRAEPAVGAAWISTTYDGTSFDLTGVARGDAVWMAADSADTTQYFVTITRQDTSKNKALSLPLMKADLIETIYNVSGASDTISAADAQLVVQLVDNNGAGIAGVTTTVAGASFVAYSEANTWQLVLTETSSDGQAFFGNIPAAKFPGGEIELALGGNLVRTLPVVVAANAVTVVRIVASP